MTELRRDLGLLEATAVVVGTMIGVGIFLGPTRIAALVETPALILLVWLVGGVVILAGAVTFAELGALLPQSGGQYAYTREAFGRFPAFLVGWSGFFVAKGAAAAALAVAFAEFLRALVPLPTLAETFFVLGKWRVGIHLTSSTLVALAILALVTWVNLSGVRRAGRLASAAMIVKLGALALLTFLGIVFFAGDLPVLASEPVAPADLTGAALVSAFLLALLPAFFAYDGWTSGGQVAEEVREPEKNVPRSLVLGVGAVVLAYALINLTYLLALGAEGVRASPFAASDSAARLLGAAGGSLVLLAVLVSILGTTNAIALSGPRIAFAMARDGHFFKGIEEVDAATGVPRRAILLQAGVSFAFAMTNTFDQILTYMVFVSFIWYAVGAAAVIALRKKMPDAPRAYRVPLYPWTPLFFIAFSGVFLLNTLIGRPVESAVGLGVLAIGVPFYLYWARARAAAPH